MIQRIKNFGLPSFKTRTRLTAHRLRCFGSHSYLTVYISARQTLS